MIVVVSVMAVALHLIKTLSAITVRCQTFSVAAVRNGAENEVVQARKLRSIGVLVILCLGLWTAGKSQDSEGAGAAKASTPVPPPEQRVDINHASLTELEKVPGLTRGWAERIVRFRPYRSKQDLFDRGVVSSQVYDRIKDFVIAHRNKE